MTDTAPTLAPPRTEPDDLDPDEWPTERTDLFDPKYDLSPVHDLLDQAHAKMREILGQYALDRQLQYTMLMKNVRGILNMVPNSPVDGRPDPYA